LISRAFWRGIGPALVLVMNPIIQYTAFEQLKNALIARRTSKLRTAVTAVTVLSDLDFFFLGAISKLGILFLCPFESFGFTNIIAYLVATSVTYPYMSALFFSIFDVTHWQSVS